ncbi:MAG: class I SAM-dependent methyltransferase [Bryobacterales bacterium]|nr:class I SAM-dependent methyltransferase [Bryobacterales bacterium]
MHTRIDFGYPWFVIYGHLLVAVPAVLLTLLAWRRRWRKPILVSLGAAALWSVVSFLIIRFGIDMNGRMPLPTSAFLASGSGKVLDMGAGSGRSALMVLEARPGTTVAALDSFGASYVRHFGGSGSSEQIMEQGRQRLLSNLRAAGVEQRVTILPADMRQLPFEQGSFDAVVSAYAIDHLDRAGVVKALSEASRVLKPHGEFLLIVLSNDYWMKFAWGPIAFHSRLRGAERWMELLHDAGLETTEHGAKPATLYFLSRKLEAAGRLRHAGTPLSANRRDIFMSFG